MLRSRRWAPRLTTSVASRSNGPRRTPRIDARRKRFILPLRRLATAAPTKRLDVGLKRLSTCYINDILTALGPRKRSIGSKAELFTFGTVTRVNGNKYTNALINETSPYLLQHAHNPVDWHAWNEEALAKARTDNKPILLSIGYSACHWCHVMEHESFENEAIAQLMNENFVNIKVDREERPDLDQIYMNAVQMLTHHGGWPMTVFLTPEGVPFYGGTYFPPEDRYNMAGFPRVLLSVAEAYRSQKDQVAHTATTMLGELRRVGIAEPSREMITTELLNSAYRRIAGNYDRTNGGFGGAPKFPPAMALEFFLHMHHRTGDPETLEMIEHTSRQMARGGI